MSLNTCKSVIVSFVLAIAVTGQAHPSKDEAISCEGAPVDPQAIAALKTMGAFLRQQQSFTVRTTTDTDYALDSGQTVRLASRGELRVRRPDRLRADIISPRKARQLFYDGKTFSMFAPRVGYYTRVNAPPTIVQLADLLEDRYAVELPLVDLFRWGTDAAALDEITKATDVGPAVIDGVETEQYAFRQPDVDWQIWIQRGNQPLPRKLVIVATDDPKHPQNAITLTWTLDEHHDDSVFQFAPPTGAVAIAIDDLSRPQTRGARR
jgi:hypothetical protein